MKLVMLKRYTSVDEELGEWIIYNPPMFSKKERSHLLRSPLSILR